MAAKHTFKGAEMKNIYRSLKLTLFSQPIEFNTYQKLPN